MKFELEFRNWRLRFKSRSEGGSVGWRVWGLRDPAFRAQSPSCLRRVEGLGLRVSALRV